MGRRVSGNFQRDARRLLGWMWKKGKGKGKGLFARIAEAMQR